MLIKCPKCSQVFSLKDDLAGKFVECPGCISTLAAPVLPAPPSLALPISPPLASPIPTLELAPPAQPPLAEPVPLVIVEPTPLDWSANLLTEAPGELPVLELAARQPLARAPSEKIISLPVPRERDSWKKVRTALDLHLFATGLYLLALLLLGVGSLMASADSSAPGGISGSGATPLLLGGVLLLVNWVMALIDHILATRSPGRHGDGPLAVASLVLSVLVLLLLVLLAFQIIAAVTGPSQPNPFGNRGPKLPQLVLEDLLLLLVLISLAELIRVTLFCFFQMAVGRSLKHSRLVSAAGALGIAYPTISVGFV